MNRELHAAWATWGLHIVDLPIWDVSRRRDHKFMCGRSLSRPGLEHDPPSFLGGPILSGPLRPSAEPFDIERVWCPKESR